MNSELPKSSPNEQRTSFKDTLQLLTRSNEKSGVSMLGAGLAAGYVGCIFQGPKAHNCKFVLKKRGIVETHHKFICP